MLRGDRETRNLIPISCRCRRWRCRSTSSAPASTWLGILWVSFRLKSPADVD